MPRVFVLLLFFGFIYHLFERQRDGDKEIRLLTLSPVVATIRDMSLKLCLIL